MEKLGATERKYLLAVYLTLNQMGWTRLKKVSTFLKVKMPSAKQFLERLSDLGLVYYETRGGILLTPEGKRIAISENAHFNAVKMFFCEILQLDQTQSDEAAWNIYFNLDPGTVSRFSDFARFLVEDEGKEVVEKFKSFLKQPRKMLAPCPLNVQNKEEKEEK